MKATSKRAGTPAGRKRQPPRPGDAQPTMALCMIVRNEARDLPGCLEPIAALFDEVHVVDTGSTDGTPEIARSLGAAVHHFAWCDDFAAARNESLRHVKSGWVLWLDADDRMDPADVAKLRRLAAGPRDTAYYCFLTSTSAVSLERSSCFQLRFFPVMDGMCFEGRVHEQVIYSLDRAGTKFANCDARIVHTGYADPATTVEKFRRNLKLLEQDLADRPDDPMLRYHMVHTLNAVGEKSRAVDAALHLMEKTDCRGRNPEMFLYVHVVLARLYEDMGDLASKERTLKRALAVEKGYAPALFFLGEEAFRRGDHDGARHLLEQVSRGGLALGTMPLPVRPILHLTEFYLGRVHESCGEDGRALARFLKASEVMPENPAGWAAVAQCALRMRRFEEMVAPLEKLIELGEDNATVRFNLGLALLELGEVDAAGIEFSAALERSPDLAPAWLNLGNIEFRRRNLDGAMASYREALRCDPLHSLAHLNLGKALLAAGTTREAEGEFLAALAGKEPPAEALGYLGDLSYARGDFARARDFLESFLAHVPERPTALLRLADCYLALGAREAALAGYHGVLALDPSNFEARERISLVNPAREPVTTH